ncbi:MAG: dUTP diphosphatase [Clostridia bacterium]|nr:dUTP diphosphatase [Clostridia bacterium]
MEMPGLKIQKLRPDAKVPERATEGSAGLDLCAAIDAPLTLAGHGTALVPTGLAIALPAAEYGAFVFARSGLAIKHGIGLLNGVGVIDSDYRGEVKVGLINQLDEPYTIEPGERIAQLVVLPVSLLPVIPCDELDETARSSGGFGSTGR